jgi:hypothetical protein
MPLKVKQHSNLRGPRHALDSGKLAGILYPEEGRCSCDYPYTHEISWFSSVVKQMVGRFSTSRLLLRASHARILI